MSVSFAVESRAPGVWGYAVRAESWSLTQPGFLEWKRRNGPCPLGALRADTTPAFAVAELQMASLVAVVSHVAECQQLPVCRQQSDWMVTTGIRPVAEEATGLGTELAENLAMIEGPVITYEAGAALQLCQSVEIEYRHTPALLTALLDTVPTITPSGLGGKHCRHCADMTASCNWCDALTLRCNG